MIYHACNVVLPILYFLKQLKLSAFYVLFDHHSTASFAKFPLQGAANSSAPNTLSVLAISRCLL